ncbi:MAG: peptide chain release factor N(5)-glutamine methyltransferase [Luminiphilus sp.]|nr:peptide chain release factor N(5)-glutamine methyltransferase [Luminiphilus sp.]
MSIRTLLAEAGCDRRDAEILMLSVCGQLDRSWLYAHGDEDLDSGQARQFSELCDRRRVGTPIAYLLGRREFWSFELEVTPEVLIPRPETEILVEWAIDLIDAHDLESVLDLGTGSGAIALAIKNERPQVTVVASDRSAGALEVARRNASRLGLDVAFHLSDWYAQLPAMSLQSLVVCNPPYVALGDPHLSMGDLPAEPLDALTDHGDGLMAIGRVIEGAKGVLRSGGWLLLEHGFEQAERVESMLSDVGFQSPQMCRDLAGLPRVSGGQWL